HGHESSGLEAVVRHLANGLIAQSVWLQMLVAAIGSVERNEEVGTVEARTAWAPAVLEAFLPRLFPEMSSDDRLKEISARFQSPDQIRSLVTVLGSLVQGHLPTYKRVEDAIRAGELAR